MNVLAIHVQKGASALTWRMTSNVNANQVCFIANQYIRQIRLLHSHSHYFLAGFSGPICEINIDECEPNPCTNDGSCQDQINGYFCQCKAGFRGVNCEININECDPNPCQNNATCLDLENRYECKCLEGFQGRQSITLTRFILHNYLHCR